MFCRFKVLLVRENLDLDLCVVTSASIIASVEEAVKVLTLKCLNQYFYKLLST